MGGRPTTLGVYLLPFGRYPTKTEKSVTGYFSSEPITDQNITKKCADRFPGRFWTISEKKRNNRFYRNRPSLILAYVFSKLYRLLSRFLWKTEKVPKTEIPVRQFRKQPITNFLDSPYMTYGGRPTTLGVYLLPFGRYTWERACMALADRALRYTRSKQKTSENRIFS